MVLAVAHSIEGGKRIVLVVVHSIKGAQEDGAGGRTQHRGGAGGGGG